MHFFVTKTSYKCSQKTLLAASKLINNNVLKNIHSTVSTVKVSRDHKSATEEENLDSLSYEIRNLKHNKLSFNRPLSHSIMEPRPKIQSETRVVWKTLFVHKVIETSKVFRTSNVWLCF